MTKLMKKTRRRQGFALGTALAALPPGLILASVLAPNNELWSGESA
jgi:hypothetical protein